MKDLKIEVGKTTLNLKKLKNPSKVGKGAYFSDITEIAPNLYRLSIVYSDDIEIYCPIPGYYELGSRFIFTDKTPTIDDFLQGLVFYNA